MHGAAVVPDGHVPAPPGVAVDVFLLGGVSVERLDEVPALGLVHALDPHAMAADEEGLAAVGHGPHQGMADGREGHPPALLGRDLGLEAGQLTALPEIMNPDKVFDAVLHGRRQVVVGRARIQELGVATGAGRRRLHAQEQRPLGRHAVERAVGMEPLGAFGEVLPFLVVGDDLAVEVEVTGGEQLRRHAAGPGRVLGSARDLQRPEAAAESDLLLVGDLRVPHHHDAVARHGGFDDLDELLRRRLDQVGADQLRGEERVQRVHLHLGSLSSRTSGLPRRELGSAKLPSGEPSCAFWSSAPMV